MANRPGTIDDIDPEFLHDFRVAVRRTRSVLGHAKDVLPADVLDWSRDGFRSLGQVTGPAARPRRLRPGVGRLRRRPGAGDVAALQPVRRQLEADRAAAHAELAAVLRSAETTSLLERVARPGSPIRSTRPPAATAPTARSEPSCAAHRQGPGPPAGGGPGDHPGHAGRGGPRAAQGRQEAALPPGVLRRAAAGGRAQGVRQAPQGAAGQPR